MLTLFLQVSLTNIYVERESKWAVGNGVGDAEVKNKYTELLKAHLSIKANRHMSSSNYLTCIYSDHVIHEAYYLGRLYV